MPDRVPGDDGGDQEVRVRFDDQDVDVSGVSDRRGRGAPLAIGGGGLGVIGLLIVLAINLLGGGTSGLDLSGLNALPAGGAGAAGESVEELEARCNADGAIERYDDCYLIKVYNEANEVWSDTLTGYEQPGLAFYEQAVSTGCGNASAEVGPFYCPADSTVYFDIGFLEALQERFGAQGRYAQAYVVAHEVGHHVQSLTGVEREVRRRQQANRRDANALSVAMELQADCLAGVWSRLADDRGNVSVTDADVEEALGAAAAIGDDRIQQRTSGRVDPESWTHGSSAQRQQWFRTGSAPGDPGACDAPFDGLT